MLALLYLAALPLVLGGGSGDRLQYPPRGLLIQHVSSSWMTRTGVWYDVWRNNERLTSTLRECPIAMTNTTGSVSFSAPATDVKWYLFDANAMNASLPRPLYRLFVDGEEQEPREELFAPCRYLSCASPPAFGWHNFTIEIVGRAQVLDAYIDTRGPQGYELPEYNDGWLINQESAPKWLSLSGDWKFRHTHWGQNAVYSPFKGASMTIRVPRGHKHVYARGDTSAGEWDTATAPYTVHIRPDPVVGPAVRSYPMRVDTGGPQYLFMADLDPAQAYEITLTSDGFGELSLSGVWVVRDRNTDLVLASLAVLALLGIVWWRRRRARRPKLPLSEQGAPPSYM